MASDDSGNQTVTVVVNQTNGQPGCGCGGCLTLILALVLLSVIAEAWPG